MPGKNADDGDDGPCKKESEVKTKISSRRRGRPEKKSRLGLVVMVTKAFMVNKWAQ